MLYFFATAACGVVTGLNNYSFACQTAADCPAPENECTRVGCVAQECATDYAPKGTQVTTPSDDACSKAVCNGAGKVVRTYAMLGTPCGTDAGCDGQGACKCDLSPNGCPSSQVGCLHCALEGECKDENDACAHDVNCLSLLNCVSSCVQSCALPITDACVYQCADSCVTQYPQGAGLYYSRIRCLACEQCPNSCSADALRKKYCTQ